MQSAVTYLELVRERGNKGLPLERVYRQLFNRDLYLMAYGKIYRNTGAMTHGVTDETPDGMSLAKIDAIIEALRYERFQWLPARRVYIPKKNGKKRPLGLPDWSSKLVQEVTRLILQAYYEPQFSSHSHGFRPERSCATALREIYYHWAGTAWFIEGDISQCFDKLSHELLLADLQEHIHDGRFIKLVRELLEAGYMEDWTLNQTWSGVPQGGIVSPVLSNILLNRLDSYVETVLIPQYTKLPAVDIHDPDYRRLKYVRYADDFLLGFVGPKAAAEEIKHQLRQFLREELKLELSEDKTLITNARKEAAKFLGYEVTTLQANDKRFLTEEGKSRRSINGRIGLRVPRSVIEAKCKDYMRNGKPIHRPERKAESDFTIISTYQLVYRGMVNYYRLAYNLGALNKLRWVMETSLLKTLAGKFRLPVSQVAKKYEAELVRDGKKYKAFQVKIPRQDKKPLVATWGGVPLTWDIGAPLEELLPIVHYGVRSELVQRLLAEVCELCGSSDDVQVHHVRKMSDLHEYPGRPKPPWVVRMIALRRKTLLLCRTCHEDVDNGRPMRRQLIEFTEVKAIRKAAMTAILESRMP